MPLTASARGQRSNGSREVEWLGWRRKCNDLKPHSSRNREASLLIVDADCDERIMDDCVDQERLIHPSFLILSCAYAALIGSSFLIKLKAYQKVKKRPRSKVAFPVVVLTIGWIQFSGAARSNYQAKLIRHNTAM
ncbi:hypothetical protein HPP92_006612 [Vanilla planifolia]|uniref:Uncharacterized protein n=1 Tax=Vanilla planifolia TaxID=51239 RepID=A0A835RER9_VANPL|nr:hypothetical protein HPP92_006612 [Vanilla planifolia]